MTWLVGRFNSRYQSCSMMIHPFRLSKEQLFTQTGAAPAALPPDAPTLPPLFPTAGDMQLPTLDHGAPPALLTGADVRDRHEHGCYQVCYQVCYYSEKGAIMLLPSSSRVLPFLDLFIFYKMRAKTGCTET